MCHAFMFLYSFWKENKIVFSLLLGLIMKLVTKFADEQTNNQIGCGWFGRYCSRTPTVSNHPVLCVLAWNKIFVGSVTNIVSGKANYYCCRIINSSVYYHYVITLSTQCSFLAIMQQYNILLATHKFLWNFKYN